MSRYEEDFEDDDIEDEEDLEEEEGRDLRISVTHEVVTENDVIVADQFEESVYSDDEFTQVESAIEFLRSEGPLEPSSRRFHPGVWYTSIPDIDEDGDQTMYKIFRLVNFDPDEQEEVFEALNRR